MSSSTLGPEWNLSPDGINIVTENETIKDPKTVLKNALNSDLKAIGKSALTHEFSSKTELEKIVLQIQKIRNVSAPKAKEDSQAAPRMLKLTLTDGVSYVQAIEALPISVISRDKTAPGTKVLVKGARLVSGFLLINPQNFSVLGGQVEHLYDKWMLAKSIQKSHQNVSSTGAPPWVPFGHKLISENQDKPFKSLEKDKDGNETTEFDLQRKEAIAEAAGGAVKKNFGGRVRLNVQPSQTNQQHGRGGRNDNDRGRRGKFASRDDEPLEKPSKPSEKVSLFSFLEDKLPISPSCSKNDCQDYHQKDPRVQAREARQASKNGSSDNVPKPNKYERNSGISNNVAPQKKDDSPKLSGKDNRNGIVTYNSGAVHEQRTNQQKYSNNQTKYQNKESLNSPHYQRGSDQYRGANNRYTPQNQGRGPQYNQQRVPRDRYPQEDVQRDNHNQSSRYHNEQTNNQTDNPAVMHQLANDLSKMSVSKEFASRSLRQHLNLGPPAKKPEGSGLLSVGESCLAKYWEDGKFYPAVVAAVTDTTYAVQFKGYGNIEEVLKQDCFTVGSSHNPNVRHHEQNNFSGSSMEFRSRRGPPRN